MVKILLTSILVFVSACGSRELNINALDLNQYVTDLSAQAESFPAYLDLMKPDQCKPLEGPNDTTLTEFTDKQFKPIFPVIPCEVKKMEEFFSDKSQMKQLFLIGPAGTEVDARIQAFAKHDVDSKLIEIRLDKLSEDSKAQSWTEADYQRVLEAVLSKNNSDKTVFLFSGPIAKINLYRAIIKPFSAEKEIVFERLSKTKKAMVVDELSFEEINYYVALMMPQAQEQAQQIALLTYAFIPTASVFDFVPLVGASETAVDVVYQEFLRQNQSPHGDNLMQIKKSMGSLLGSPEANKLATFNRKFFRDRLQAKIDNNLEQMSKIAQSFEDKYKLDLKAYCLSVLKYASVNGLPDSMQYLLKDCKENK
jgi:hypothetical protein